jgi:hypothetical protein
MRQVNCHDTKSSFAAKDLVLSDEPLIHQFMLTCKPTCDAKLCSLTVETNTPPLSKQEIWMPSGSTDLSMCTRRNSPGDGLYSRKKKELT